MDIARRIENLPALTASVCTLGMFDGVHLGHQAILNQTVQRARELNLTAAAITFSNHPRSVLPGRDAPGMLTPLEYKLVLLQRTGLDQVLVLDFNTVLSQTSRREFVERYFVTAMQSQTIVLGFDSKFGYQGRGDIEYLKDMEAGYDFNVETVPPVLLQGQAVSSTRIRQRIDNGNLDRAANKLGRPYALYGPVVTGDGRGSKLGISTANVDVSDHVLPPAGVYAQKATLADGRHFWAATNIGTRPTFYEDGQLTVEAHLLDFEGDLLGQDITLEFVARLRAERRFDNADDLMQQIKTDISKVRTFADGAKE